MNTRIELNEQQKMLLQRMIYAVEKRGTYENMAALTAEPLYQTSNTLLNGQIEETVKKYDSVFWESLEALTGLTVDTFSAYDAGDDVERLIEGNNMNELNYEKGIDAKRFFEYLRTKNNFEYNSFTAELIENVIDWGQKHHTTSKDSFAYFLLRTVPELSDEEAHGFIDDDLLTEEGLKYKRDFWRFYK